MLLAFVFPEKHNASCNPIPMTNKRRHTMAKVKQLTISLENQPGRLADVAQALSDARVNIVAFLGSTAERRGSVQVVVDNIRKARKALNGAQFSFAEGTLEQVELPNKPGALAEFAATLAKKDMNIDAAYGSVPKGARKSVLYFATSKRSAQAVADETIGLV
jgi:hypothetical protein